MRTRSAWLRALTVIGLAIVLSPAPVHAADDGKKKPAKSAGKASNAATKTVAGSPKPEAKPAAETPAAPEIDPEQPKVSIDLVDAKGKLRESGWKTTARWSWKPAGELGLDSRKGAAESETPAYLPVLLVDAELSKGVSLVGIGKESPGIKVISPQGASAAAPASELRLQLTGFDRALEVELRENGASTKVSLTLDLQAARDPLLVHESCAAESIAAELVPARTSVRPRFVGVQCAPFESKVEREKGKVEKKGKAEEAKIERGVHLFIHAFDEAKLGAVTAGAEAGKSSTDGFSWVRRRIVEPKDGWKFPEKTPEIRLGGFSVEGASGQGKMAEYRVSLRGDADGQGRWGFSVNTGLTYLAYSESPASVSVKEWLWTVKGGADFRLVPGKFTLSASGFANAIVLSRTPDSEPSARFFGVNGRFTYHLPLKLPQGYELAASVGKYLWGTVVPGGAYGIQILSGYQVFVQGMYRAAGIRKASAYVKFSPISESALGVSFDNYEFAVGGAYRLSPASTRKFPLSLTLDWSMLRINEIEAAPNTAELDTLSLGVATEF